MQSTSESKSAYCCLLHMCNASKSGFSKFQYKMLWLHSGKIEKNFFFLFFENDKIWNFERLFVLRDHPADFHDFQEQIQLSRNARHICAHTHTHTLSLSNSKTECTKLILTHSWNRPPAKYYRIQTLTNVSTDPSAAPPPGQALGCGSRPPRHSG